MPAPTASTMPATTADASSEPSSLLSIVDRTAYDRLIKSIADDLPQATQQKFRGKEEVMTDDDEGSGTGCGLSAYPLCTHNCHSTHTYTYRGGQGMHRLRQGTEAD